MKLLAEDFAKAAVIVAGFCLLLSLPTGATERMVVGEMITSTS